MAEPMRILATLSALYVEEYALLCQVGVRPVFRTGTDESIRARDIGLSELLLTLHFRITPQMKTSLSAEHRGDVFAVGLALTRAANKSL